MTIRNAEYTRYLFLNAVLWRLKETKRLPTASNNRILLGTTPWYCSGTALRHQICGVPYCPAPSIALRHQNCGVPYCPVPSTALRHQNCGVPYWPVPSTALRHQNCGVSNCPAPSTALRHQNCGVPYCPVPSTALRHHNCGVPYCPVPFTALRHQNCGVPKWPVPQLWYTSLPGHFVTLDFPLFNCRLLKPGVMLRHSYDSQPWLLDVSLFICNPVIHAGKQATRPACLPACLPDISEWNATVHIAVLPVQSLSSVM